MVGPESARIVNITVCLRIREKQKLINNWKVVQLGTVTSHNEADGRVPLAVAGPFRAFGFGSLRELEVYHVDQQV